MNVDESWLAETNYNRKIWVPTDGEATVSTKPMSMKVAIIAALDSDGRIYFALTHSITNSEVIGMFLGHLCRELDLNRPEWRRTTVVLLDGAKYHLSEETREYLKKL